jgi:internalin A
MAERARQDGEDGLGAVEAEGPPLIDIAFARIAECKRTHSEELDLGGLRLTEIPKAVEELGWLKRLYLGQDAEARKRPEYGFRKIDEKSCNTVRALPASLFFALPYLQLLDLNHNAIAALPDAIGQLTGLQTLGLGGNQLTALPDAIGQLTALVRFTLDDNLLTELPEALGQLTALEGLGLDRNQLILLPAAIGQLAALQTLTLDGNQLTSLPTAIGHLTALHRLWLSGNQLTEITEGIGQLTSLQTLSLSGNLLTFLPAPIGRLANLKSLYLSHNQLTELPNSIGQLTALESLDLDGNLLTALPDVIGQLATLERLDIDDNRLAALPRAIGRLTALVRLDLSNNWLTALPEAIGQLTALQTLYLSGNELTALPDAIGQLSALRTLSLSNNQLTALPMEFGKLKSLQKLALGGNPLTYPPMEFVDQGPEAVVAFLARVMTDGQAFHESKIVLVGDPKHGKTALRSWIEHGEFRKPAESTRGGEVGFRDLMVGQAQGRVNIWDFGGQDRYRPAQQPLFTPGALYLLLCDKRTNIGEAGVPEWLRLIQLRAGSKARLLLVFTYMGSNDGMPSLAILKDDIRQMITDHDMFGINSPDGVGIPALLDRIWHEVGRLPGFYDNWPRSYLKARDAVLALRSQDISASAGNYISYGQFLEICRPFGVEGFEARVLARALSQQGRLDYKGSEVDADQIVVLNPEWLLKAIAYVIDDKQLSNQGGILHRRDLARIWRDHNRPLEDKPIRFEENLWPHLLKLMISHELIYRLSDEEWIVPQKVTDAPIDPVPWTQGSQGSQGIRLDCSLDYPISGLMAFLTVRHHYKHAGRRFVWQRGAFLRHPHTGAEALIRVDGEQTIRMEARGPAADVLLIDLQSTLEALVDERWPGVAGEKRRPYRFTVPCPKCSGSFSLTSLRAAKSKQDVAYCDGEGHDVSIVSLLYGIEASEEAEEGRRARRMHLTYGRHPRQLDISDVPTETMAGKAQSATKRRIKVQVCSEVSGSLVDGASDVVEVDKDWWEAAKKWGPTAVRGAIGAATAIFTGVPIGLPDVDLGGRGDPSVGQLADMPKGRVEIPLGQIMPSAVADRLISIANRGNMRQTEMADGSWLWASPSEWRRNDPNVPKE